MSRNGYFIGALVALVIGGGFILWGRTNDVAPQTVARAAAKSTIVASKDTYDFGRISMRDGNVNYVFELANTSERDIKIERIATSCMCTNAFILEGGVKKGPFGMDGHGGANRADKILRAGDKMKLEVVFDPNAHGPAGVGPMERFIALLDSNGATLVLQVKALVVP